MKHFTFFQTGYVCLVYSTPLFGLAHFTCWVGTGGQCWRARLCVMAEYSSRIFQAESRVREQPHRCSKCRGKGRQTLCAFPFFHIYFSFSFFFFFFLLFRVALAAYGHSQAGSRIGATAARLQHSHSNTGSKPRLPPDTTAHSNVGSLTC